MEFVPHDYQRAAMQWILDKPKCGLFLDMGLGKTVTTLTALDYLMYQEFEIDKALVVAPKRVVTDTWARECQKWDHLNHLKVSPIVGTPRERRAAIRRQADIYLVSRDNIKWLIETLDGYWPYDVLVLDELSSFKNPQTNRFKALRKVAYKCKRVIGLTGTPAPNGYTDLWSQIYLLDQGERLGKTLTDFRRRYCEAIRYPYFVKWSVPKEHLHDIDRKISDICISMTAKDYLKLPPVYSIIMNVTLDKKAQRAYDEMKQEAVLELAGTEIIGVTAAALMNKLLQIAGGAVYDDDGAVTEIHDAKLEALEQIIEESQGQPVLVFYSYRFDASRIRRRFPEARTMETDQDISDWNAGTVPLMLAHPASCGHGLNLQEGGHIIVWFGPTWSLELYQQANARLNRQGQDKPVMIYHLIASGTVDERVMEAIQNKSTTQAALIDCVKAEIGSVMNNVEENAV